MASDDDSDYSKSQKNSVFQQEEKGRTRSSELLFCVYSIFDEQWVNTQIGQDGTWMDTFIAAVDASPPPEFDFLPGKDKSGHPKLRVQGHRIRSSICRIAPSSHFSPCSTLWTHDVKRISPRTLVSMAR